MTTRSNHTDPVIKCPCCGKPTGEDLSKQPWGCEIAEILTVPVVERIGSLAIETRWASNNADYRLGGLLNLWNQTVGLQRYSTPVINVKKKEFKCASPECGARFDCFVNCHPEYTFQDYWPHLTGLGAPNAPYCMATTRSGIEKFLAWGKKLGLGAVPSLLLLALFAATASFLPDLIRGRGLADPGFLEAILFRTLAALLAVWMIAAVLRLANHMRESFGSFQEIFVVQDPDSYCFWFNFNFGRVVGNGVSETAKPSPAGGSALRKWLSRQSVSQAAAVGGIPSLLLALILWIMHSATRPAPLNWGTYFEVGFWLIVIYLTGISAWTGFNIGVFMLGNMSLVPMKLTPLNNFDTLQPVVKIANLCLAIVVPVVLMPVLFVTARFAMPVASELLLPWLLPWVQWVIGLALLIIGLGDMGIFVLGLAYIAIVTLISSLPAALQASLGPELAGISGIVVLGIFLSILLGYQLYRAFGPIKKAMVKKTQEITGVLDHLLASLSDDLRRIEMPETGSRAEHENQRDMILRDIERVRKLRSEVLGIRPSIFDIKAWFSVASPIVSSITLPIVIEVVRPQVLQLLNIPIK